MLAGTRLHGLGLRSRAGEMAVSVGLYCTRSTVDVLVDLGDRTIPCDLVPYYRTSGGAHARLESEFVCSERTRSLKKEKNEFELLTMENDLRKKMGLSTFENYQAFLDRGESDEEPNIDEAILLEAANILTDFIEYSYKPVISMNKAG